MKKKVITFTVFFTVLFAMVGLNSANAAICEGSLTLGSQAEVNAFDCSEVTGSLTISGADIVDLSSLSVLTSVGGSLTIDDNPALTVVDGFDKLTSVGGGIWIYYNPAMISFSGFDALLSTGDNIDFWYNDSLVTVSGFSSLKTVGWSLEFGGSPVLAEIPEFESLHTISSSLYILDNISLTNITGFNNLQSVGWSFDILWNYSLNNICGFYNYFADYYVPNPDASFNISENHPDLPSPMSVQDILDAGPCTISSVQQIDDLIADIGAMDLSRGTSNKLIKSLTSAKKSLESGKDGTAISQLEDLKYKIDFLEQRGKIDGASADYLIAAVYAIIDSINF